MAYLTKETGCSRPESGNCYSSSKAEDDCASALHDYLITEHMKKTGPDLCATEGGPDGPSTAKVYVGVGITALGMNKIIGDSVEEE